MIKAFLLASVAFTFAGLTKLAFGASGASTTVRGVLLLLCGAAMLIAAAAQARRRQ